MPLESNVENIVPVKTVPIVIKQTKWMFKSMKGSNNKILEMLKCQKE